MINTIKEFLGLGTKVDFSELVKRGAMILDVRTKAEYTSGHIKGSVNIPVDVLSNSFEKIRDKNRPIITCCASGMRSSSAKRILKANGYMEVHNGGGWDSLKSKI